MHKQAEPFNAARIENDLDRDRGAPRLSALAKLSLAQGLEADCALRAGDERRVESQADLWRRKFASPPERPRRRTGRKQSRRLQQSPFRRASHFHVTTCQSKNYTEFQEDSWAKEEPRFIRSGFAPAPLARRPGVGIRSLGNAAQGHGGSAILKTDREREGHKLVRERLKQEFEHESLGVPSRARQLREGKSSTTAAPRAPSRGCARPERDYNKADAGGVPSGPAH